MLTGGLHFNHFRRQVDHRVFGQLLLTHPRLPADAGQLRPAADATHVLLHQFDLGARYVDLRAAVILELKMLFRPPFLLE